MTLVLTGHLCSTFLIPVSILSIPPSAEHMALYTYRGSVSFLWQNTVLTLAKIVSPPHGIEVSGTEHCDLYQQYDPSPIEYRSVNGRLM